MHPTLIVAHVANLPQFRTHAAGDVPPRLTRADDPTNRTKGLASIGREAGGKPTLTMRVTVEKHDCRLAQKHSG